MIAEGLAKAGVESWRPAQASERRPGQAGAGGAIAAGNNPDAKVDRATPAHGPMGIRETTTP